MLTPHYYTASLLALIAAGVSAKVRFPERRSPFDRLAPRVAGIYFNPCDDENPTVECGTFEVPLDYHNPSSAKVSLAVARFPATAGQKLGTIFTNPGGPGNSGVDGIVKAGALLSQGTGGLFDIVSWDPRGVGETLPSTPCFDSLGELNALKIEADSLTPHGLEFRGNFSDPAEVDLLFSTEKAWDTFFTKVGAKCLEAVGDDLKFIGSAAAARDLVALADALEGSHTPVNYWGFSYGTLIGQNFINMFPDRVGRVVLDGVIDPIAWSVDQPHKGWSKNVEDADETLEGFAWACAEGGPSSCALAEEGSDKQWIVNFVDALILKAFDLTAKFRSKGVATRYTPSFIRFFLFQGLRSPRDWVRLAFHLKAFDVEISHNLNGETLNEAAVDAALAEFTDEDDIEDLLNVRLTAILCGDAVDSWHISTKDVLEEARRVTQEITPRFGLNFFDISNYFCHKWPVRAAERFQGPFNKHLANPILLIGNEADPITPFDAAQRSADLLGNSATLIQQDDFGHVSISLRSNCTMGAVFIYFTQGKLPEDDLFCSVDEVVFPGSDVTTGTISNGVIEDEEDEEEEGTNKTGDQWEDDEEVDDDEVDVDEEDEEDEGDEWDDKGKSLDNEDNVDDVDDWEDDEEDNVNDVDDWQDDSADNGEDESIPSLVSQENDSIVDSLKTQTKTLHWLIGGFSACILVLASVIGFLVWRQRNAKKYTRLNHRVAQASEFELPHDGSHEYVDKEKDEDKLNREIPEDVRARLIGSQV